MKRILISILLLLFTLVLSYAQSISYFGKKADLKPDHSYRIEEIVGGDTVILKLKLGRRTFSKNVAFKLEQSFLTKLQEIDRNNKEVVKRNYLENTSEAVTLYFDHHHTEIYNDQFLIQGTVDVQSLLSRLHLTEATFYPDNAEAFAVFDYSFGRELTQYVLTITYNIKGEIVSFSMNS
ncbi:DUF2004 domain-containing protein [Sphingobacterium sp.]|uniref:DUF2004 domain-containing protein n=1 Tax=Sphingobacterium sp. TaxID=341027 RepID=UPI0031D898EF